MVQIKMSAENKEMMEQKLHDILVIYVLIKPMIIVRIYFIYAFLIFPIN